MFFDQLGDRLLSVVYTCDVTLDVMRSRKALSAGLKVRRGKLNEQPNPKLKKSPTWLDRGDTFLTYRALERFVAGMRPDVGLQFLPGKKGLGTSLAFVIANDQMSPLTVVNQR